MHITWKNTRTFIWLTYTLKNLESFSNFAGCTTLGLARVDIIGTFIIFLIVIFYILRKQFLFLIHTSKLLSIGYFSNWNFILLILLFIMNKIRISFELLSLFRHIKIFLTKTELGMFTTVNWICFLWEVMWNERYRPVLFIFSAVLCYTHLNH